MSHANKMNNWLDLGVDNFKVNVIWLDLGVDRLKVKVNWLDLVQMVRKCLIY